MRSPQPDTAPEAQLAWRLGGAETYPCAEAGETATKSDVTTAATVSRGSDIRLLMKGLHFMADGTRYGGIDRPPAHQ
jgi:hypothetical protein